MARFRTDALVVAMMSIASVLFFSKIGLSQNYLTSGDGVSQALTEYFGRMPFWEPKMLLGYPLLADPNAAFWYPLLRLCRLIPGAFNAYAIAPYVLVAFGTFGFARRISGSVAGAIVAAVTIALGGFMISHQGHLMLIHPAAFGPYVFWAIAELRIRRRPQYIAAGALALAIGISSGAQQPLLYLCVVGIAYAIVFSPTERQARVAFMGNVAVLFALGLLLSAISTIPEVEFATRSNRQHLTLAEFSVYSTNILEFPIRALFPYFFGATGALQYPYSHDIVGAFTETTNYAGILALLLAACAPISRAVRSQTFFWIGVMVFAAWMSVGNAFFAASIAHHVPVYDLFRIPGRHAIEFTFAIAMLAALGVAELERAQASWLRIGSTIVTGSVLFAIMLFVVAAFGNVIRATISTPFAVALVPVTPMQNPAIGIPCIVFLASCAVFVVWARCGARLDVRIIGVLAVACDMFVFAGASYWSTSSTSQTVLQRPPQATRLQSLISKNGGRIIATLGSATAQSVPPNLSTFWSLDDASGYVSLEDPAIADILHVDGSGALPDGALGIPGDVGADVAGVRYLVLPPEAFQSLPIANPFSVNELVAFIASPQLSPSQTATFALPEPRTGTEVDLVTDLGVSATIADQAHVADLRVVAQDGVHTFAIIAGRDTAESAYDRPDIRPTVRHSRAQVIGGSDTAHLYLARFRLMTNSPVYEISVRWTYVNPAVGALTIVHASLLDSKSRLSYPFTDRARLDVDRLHWRTIHSEVASEQIVENLRAFPPAWIVSHDTMLPRSDQLRRMTRGDDINAPSLDARSDVLTEEKVQLGPRALEDSAQIMVRGSTRATYRVRCRARCMLVTNDLWYPGWIADVDGVATPLLRADYLFRGIVVPAGAHSVSLHYAPTSLLVGGLLTFGAFICILVLLYRSRNVPRMLCDDLTSITKSPLPVL